jgi:nitrate/TMAO reductase-like tetraheme cytochrome c subunit
MIAGAIVFALIVIMFITLELTSQDSFCASCHINAEAARTWKTSPHQKTHCVQCHAPVGYYEKVFFKATTGLSEAWVNFFGDPKREPGAGRPDNENCLQCHRIKDVVTTMGIKIPHKKLAGETKNRCADCHFDIAHAEPGVPARPSMSTCMKCHDGKKLSRECSTCHTATASATAAGLPGYLCADCHLNGGKLNELSPLPPAAAETGG